MKEYPIEVRTLIDRLVSLRDHDDVPIWSLAIHLLRQWDHDRSVK